MSVLVKLLDPFDGQPSPGFGLGSWSVAQVMLLPH